MLIAIKGLFSSWNAPKKEPFIFIGGLDAAGKTTMMYKFKEYTINPYPRFSAESAKVLGVECCSFDPMNVPEGTTHPRSIAKREFVKENIAKADALVWVIDARDPERFDESKLEFDKIYQLKASTTVPILLLANKQDIPNVVPHEQISDRFDLKSLKNRWNIFPTTATSGDNLYEAFSWLLLELKDQGFAIKHEIQPVVSADCEINK